MMEFVTLNIPAMSSNEEYPMDCATQTATIFAMNAFIKELPMKMIAIAMNVMMQG